jgi:hypothetical protein
MRAENKEKCEMKQAAETREDGVARDKGCKHESHEDWRERGSVANNLETNTLQTSDDQSEKQTAEQRDHGNRPLEKIFYPQQ